MPNVKSAKKRVKTNLKCNQRNRIVRTVLRNALKDANTAVLNGDVEAAKTAVPKAIKIIGRTARKSVIHRNKASRQESRLMKKYNALLNAQTSE